MVGASNDLTMIGNQKNFFYDKEERRRRYDQGCEICCPSGYTVDKRLFQRIPKKPLKWLRLNRRQSSPFADEKTGDNCVQSYFYQNGDVPLKRYTQFEKYTAIAMKPENLFLFYAKLLKIFSDYNITAMEKVFNFDESGGLV